MFTHGAVASRYMGEDVVYEAFADWTKAQVRPEVKATLGMLAKLTKQPLDFSAEDMKPLLALDIDPAGIEQAVIIGGFLFNYQNWMADAMGADVPRDKINRAGKMLNMQGRSMLKDHNATGDVAAFNGRFPPEIEALVESVTNGDGSSDKALRQAVFRRGMAYLGFAETDINIPEDLVHYVDTTTRHAPEVTEQDIQDLLNKGWSEPEIFEVTVAAAVAAGNGRLRIAWNALAEALQE